MKKIILFLLLGVMVYGQTAPSAYTSQGLRKWVNGAYSSADSLNANTDLLQSLLNGKFNIADTASVTGYYKRAYIDALLNAKSNNSDTSALHYTKLALKAPLADPTFTGVVTTPKLITNDSLRIGDANNYVGIDPVKGLRFYGTATNWEDIRVSVYATKQGAVDKPAFVADSGAYNFIADSTEFLSGSVELPHGWKIGSNLHPHIHLLQTATNDTSQYTLKWKWHNLGGLDGAWHYTTLNSREITYSSGSIQQLLEGAPMDATGKTLSSIIVFQLKRKNAIGLTNNYVYNIGFHYEIDAMGSSSELSKD